MNKTLLAALAATVGLGASAGASAQAYPTKPITVIVPFEPGGGVDVLTRAVGVELGKRWGKPLVVENKPGAGSLIGTSMVAKAPADGYTLLATVNQTFVANRYLYKQLPYDPDKDFTPILMMVRADQLIIANAGLPANTLKEAVALAHSKPHTLSYGSFGPGSQPHLLFATVNKRESLDLLHVPYKGITPVLAALAGGEVQLGTGSVAVAKPLIDAGKIKPLAVAGDSRLAQYPNVSTTTEQGFPYAKTSIWYALFAPAGTPQAVVDKIRRDVQQVIRDPEFAKQQIESRGLAVVAGDGKQLAAAIREESDAYAEMVKAAGVEPE